MHPDDSFGCVAFLNDHGTWSRLHGHVEEIRSASGDLVSIVLHFHCLGANALLRNPQAQVTLRPCPSGAPGRVVGQDHRGRRVTLELIRRRDIFSCEEELREYMTDLRNRSMLLRQDVIV